MTLHKALIFSFSDNKKSYSYVYQQKKAEKQQKTKAHKVVTIFVYFSIWKIFIQIYLQLFFLCSICFVTEYKCQYYINNKMTLNSQFKIIFTKGISTRNETIYNPNIVENKTLLPYASNIKQKYQLYKRKIDWTIFFET